MSAPTLAARLGTTAHFSPLLRKARNLWLTTPVELSHLAVQRGCRHYWHEGVPEGELPPREQSSDEELALALLYIALPFDPQAIRCGSAGESRATGTRWEARHGSFLRPRFRAS